MFFIPLVTFAGNMKLHYDRPAEYFEEALVIGNGTMGATLYGGVKKDKISFNDITLWTGEPESENSSPDAFNVATEFTKIVPVSGPSVGTPNGRSDDFVGRFSP